METNLLSINYLLGDRAIIAFNAIVVKDVAPYSLVGGILRKN